MIDMKFTLNTAGFDRFLRKLPEYKAKSLQHAAAIIRKEAQSSMRPGKVGKPSKPGEPPHSVTGRLKRSITYQSDGNNVVVVGAEKLSAAFYGHFLEHGATFQKKVGKKKQKTIQVRIEPRPFMQPALEHTAHRLPLSFRGSLVKDLS